jgi:tetratricopeptide (TPR) repeat protein
MKHIITTICLVFAFRIVCGQADPARDMYFEKTEFEHAKINNEDAALFFMHFPYNTSVAGTDGNVFVSFIVTKTGQLDSIRVLNKPSGLYKDTALDALYKSSGKWNPSNFDGILFDKRYIGGFNFTKTQSFFYKKEKGLKYTKSGQTEKALKFINEALKINPFDTELYFCRARIYRIQGKYDLEMLDLTIIDKLKADLLFNIWF